jgi:acyl-CoA synthetase (AMP-forming)/AMP-acid ligase II
VGPGGELTYPQLVTHSGQVAAALEPLRLPQDRPVAVLMPRSAQQIAVMLGVMRSTSLRA